MIYLPLYFPLSFQDRKINEANNLKEWIGEINIMRYQMIQWKNIYYGYNLFRDHVLVIKVFLVSLIFLITSIVDFIIM